MYIVFVKYIYVIFSLKKKKQNTTFALMTGILFFSLYYCISDI